LKKIKYMKKKILVTGGCGFVGKNISNFFNKKYKVIIIDNYTSGNKKFIPKNVSVNKINIQNYDNLLKIFKKYNFYAVIHCAANFANQSSIDNIDLDMQSNINGTINLLKISKKHKIKKFIYLSSSCIYSSEESSEDIVNPSFKTPYAISKFSGEQYVSFFKDYYKLNASIFRLYNFYGPYDYIGKYRNVIPNFINRALKNKLITIHAKGLSTRDFTYVKDFVKVLEKVLLKYKKFNKIYNFGGSKKIKIIDLAKKIIRYTNSKSKIKFIPSRKWDKFSKRKANNKKIRHDFKNIKFTKIDEGLIKTIKWMKEH
tara:strand:- start:10070 stop:11011 length:942 start_codon:yes stop_codon:yes gene_type:complete